MTTEQKDKTDSRIEEIISEIVIVTDGFGMILTTSELDAVVRGEG